MCTQLFVRTQTVVVILASENKGKKKPSLDAISAYSVYDVRVLENCAFPFPALTRIRFFKPASSAPPRRRRFARVLPSAKYVKVSP